MCLLENVLISPGGAWVCRQSVQTASAQAQESPHPGTGSILTTSDKLQLHPFGKQHS